MPSWADLEEIPAEHTQPASISTARKPQCPEPWLWLQRDPLASEKEVHEFLWALVRLVKPQLCLETGTYLGHSAAAMGLALQENGRGHLFTIECEPERAHHARVFIRKHQLEEAVTVITGDSLQWSPPGPIDLAFFDSGLKSRIPELHRFGRKGQLVVFHDADQRELREPLAKLVDAGALQGFHINSPRGVFVGQVTEELAWTM